jgi:ATP-dependent DNA helicase RecG
MLGTKQSGLPDFNLADLIKDEPVLLLARKVAIEILRQDPELRLDDNKILAKMVDDSTVLELGESLN